MMNPLPPPQASSDDLSLVEQIQRVEAEVSRQIVSKRDEAHQAELQAREQAAVRLREAQAEGQHAGQLEYEQIVAQAAQGAQALRESASRESDLLRSEGDQCMESAVQLAIAILTGTPQE